MAIAERAKDADGRHLGIGVSVFLEPAPGPPDLHPSVGAFVAPLPLGGEIHQSLEVHVDLGPAGDAEGRAPAGEDLAALLHGRGGGGEVGAPGHADGHGRDRRRALAPESAP